MIDRIGLIRRISVCVLTCLLVTLLAGANPPAYAAPQSPPPTFTVNSTSDVIASAPLDNGICETAPHNNTCTLRAAIEKANNFPGGGVTIILPALAEGAKYALVIDQLIITNTMTIMGGGAAQTIIDASGLIGPPTRVMLIQSGAVVTISEVTVEGGNALYSSGGGIAIAGSSLALRDSIVTSNTDAFGGGLAFFGGALTVTDSLISQNRARVDGGGILIGNGLATLMRVTISGNTAGGYGGGSGGGYGGGLFNETPDLLDIVDSTISDNDATDGGGIDNSGTSLAVVNSTISQNFADENGGGIFNALEAAPCCTVNFDNATIVGNEANQAMVGGTGGGLFNNSYSTVRLQNTLLHGNVRSTAGQDVFDDCSGTVDSLGYNLFSTTAGCTISGGTHDFKNVAGQTGPLQNNGGPTFTNALLPNSPAIDAGNPAACTDNLGVTLHADQRGAPRPANGAGATRCDIGAFELQRTLDLPLVLR